MITEILCFLRDNSPLGIVGLGFAIGYVFTTKQTRRECATMHQNVNIRMMNQQSQMRWLMETLFAVAQKHQVSVEPPPIEESNG